MDSENGTFIVNVSLKLGYKLVSILFPAQISLQHFRTTKILILFRNVNDTFNFEKLWKKKEEKIGTICEWLTNANKENCNVALYIFDRCPVF